MEHIVVFITASDEDEAEAIGRALVEAHLAACVTIIKNVRSMYRWQGKIENEAEAFMVVKTQRNLFAPISAKVKELHSYTVPEIIALPIVEGSADYLNWLKESTSSDK
jgi:periplasmic divalent cation tolerance protein